MLVDSGRCHVWKLTGRFAYNFGAEAHKPRGRLDSMSESVEAMNCRAHLGKRPVVYSNRPSPVLRTVSECGPFENLRSLGPDSKLDGDEVPLSLSSGSCSRRNCGHLTSFLMLRSFLVLIVPALQGLTASSAMAGHLGSPGHGSLHAPDRTEDAVL